MTKEKLRLICAELDGWIWNELQVIRPNGTALARHRWMHDTLPNEDQLLNIIPNYPEDLNAVHELEEKLTPDNSPKGQISYDNILMRICGSHQACVSAEALQRCEALVKLHGKWEEE